MELAELKPYMEDARAFVQQYAKDHEYFGAEEVCDAYKAAGLPLPPDKGWRDRWGSVMAHARNKGWIKKAGNVVPKSGATHMASTALWLSNLYKGERTLIIADVDHLNQLKAAWMTREITDIRVLLQKAYEFGFNQGAAGKAKIKGG
jgi:hypothetical protein